MSTTGLTVADFGPFFRAVHGDDPFAWQADLAERVIEGEGWPEGIDIPTGLGKTAVIDIAVFALAAQAGREPGARTAPTRTFMVVDRRVIVDQSHGRAGKIARALVDPAAPPVVQAVAAALRSLTAGGQPLQVVRMRGGTTWGWRWLADLAQPAVIVATVDQFGSRLLFRGYGVGNNLRPIDAALCGTDSLLVLDEAHLSQPLIDTVRAVATHEGRASDPAMPRRPSAPVLLSATLPAGMATFRPDLDQETSGKARARLDATRTARLVDLATSKDAGPELALAMASLARHGIARPGVERVAVVCNTVRLARQVFEQLERDSAGADIALLIGRCRQVEREAVNEEWLPRFEAREHRPDAGPVIAVATQTIEVGADFDFDFLVTEATPLDALLQRLGRLNRLGRTTGAEAVVVHAAARHDDDPVYGPATARTWEWLVGEAGTPSPVRAAKVSDERSGDPSIDLGPSALTELLTPDDRRRLGAEPPLWPVVLGPVIDSWARTSPIPVPDQPVAPYLHGIGRPAADVLVCWRAGLPPASDGGALEAWEEELRTAPPRSGETVSVPIWEAERFLAGAGDSGRLSDLEGALDLDIDLDEHLPVPAVILSPDRPPSNDRRRLRPGDTVVVQSEAGGHDSWGWTGVPGPAVPDVADHVLRRRLRVRLRSAVLVSGPGSRERDEVEAVLHGLVDKLGRDRADDRVAVTAVLVRLSPIVGDAAGAGSLRALAASGFKVEVVKSGWAVATGPLLPAETIDRFDTPPPDGENGDDEEWASSSSTRRVTLEKHLVDVGRGARRQARLVGLRPEVAAAVELAGRAHDLGKADARFQAMLHGGDELAALASPHPLAKSGMDPGDRDAYRKAREQSGWPRGMRHESISAALVAELVRTTPELFSDVDTDLVRHLVQSHHGRGRPLLPPVVDDDPHPVVAGLPGANVLAEVASDRDLVDWEGPARFASLGRRYGWWGLALLEAIVRLSDMAASQSYEQDEVRS